MPNAIDITKTLAMKRFHKVPKKKYGLVGTLIASNLIWITIVASLWFLFWSSTKFSEIITQNYIESKNRYQKITAEQQAEIAARDRKIARLIAYQTSSPEDVTVLAKKIAIILHSATGIKKKFLEQALPEAIRLQVEHNVPASAIISMAILESSYGRSALASDHHNYFGIKAFSNWSGPRVENMPTVDSGVKTRADFRAYNGLADGFQGYADFLMVNSRYAGAFTQQTGIGFVRSLLKAGYCPDHDYDDKILKIIEEHRLDELDMIIKGAKQAPYQMAWKNGEIDESSITEQILEEEPLPES